MRSLVEVMIIVALGITLTAAGYMRGEKDGIAEGRSIGIKEALKTNPVSEQLEMVCAGLWVGEQNKKYWKKENAK